MSTLTNTAKATSESVTAEPISAVRVTAATPLLVGVIGTPA